MVLDLFELSVLDAYVCLIICHHIMLYKNLTDECGGYFATDVECVAAGYGGADSSA